VPGGVVHKLPEDLRNALVANPAALAAWKDITPLGRNEFICWVEDAKQQGVVLIVTPFSASVPVAAA
jgi:hypothetical protein